MVFTDYRIQRTAINASNGSLIRTIYTTEYPCLVWCEVPLGELAGFNGTDHNCFFDIVYTGDNTQTHRTYIWGSDLTQGNFGQGTDVVTPYGTIVGYCPRSGISVRFNTQDDDHSGFVNLHILRLPESSGIITDVTV